MSIFVKIKNIIRNIVKYFYLVVVKYIFTKAKFDKYQKEYLLIPNCRDKELKNKYHKGLLKKIDKPISIYYKELLELIDTKVKNKTPFIITRASDGEAFFLQRKIIGNINRRHYTKEDTLETVNVKKFKEGLLNCDSRHCEMDKRNQKMFQTIYGKNIFSDIPFECIYALIASKKLLTSDYRLGIIGSGKKIDIIKKLLNFKQYRSYIGRDKFDHYISVPDTGTANDTDKLLEDIQAQLRDDIDVYLVGIGIAKLAILHRLKEKSRSVFIDVGCGISALAGLVSHDRQYYADWINFRLRNYNYESVDIMDFDIKDEKKILL